MQPGGARESQGEPGKARESKGEPGRARESQEERGRARESQGEPGRAKPKPKELHYNQPKPGSAAMFPTWHGGMWYHVVVGPVGWPSKGLFTAGSTWTVLEPWESKT